MVRRAEEDESKSEVAEVEPNVMMCLRPRFDGVKIS